MSARTITRAAGDSATALAANPTPAHVDATAFFPVIDMENPISLIRLFTASARSGRPITQENPTGLRRSGRVLR